VERAVAVAVAAMVKVAVAAMVSGRRAAKVMMMERELVKAMR